MKIEHAFLSRIKTIPLFVQIFFLVSQGNYTILDCLIQYSILEFIYTPYTFTRTPYTFTVIGGSGKTQKAPEKTGAVKQKKTEIPIFQGISVVLPKVYLGGRSAEFRTLGLVVPNHARYQLRHTPMDIKLTVKNAAVDIPSANCLYIL